MTRPFHSSQLCQSRYCLLYTIACRLVEQAYRQTPRSWTVTQIDQAKSASFFLLYKKISKIEWCHNSKWKRERANSQVLLSRSDSASQSESSPNIKHWIKCLKMDPIRRVENKSWRWRNFHFTVKLGTQFHGIYFLKCRLCLGMEIGWCFVTWLHFIVESNKIIIRVTWTWEVNRASKPSHARLSNFSLYPWRSYR